MEVDNDRSVDTEDTRSKTNEANVEQLLSELEQLKLANLELKNAMDEDRRKAYEKREAAKEEARRKDEEAGLFKQVNEELKKELLDKNGVIESLNNTIKENTAILDTFKKRMLERIPEELRDELKDLPLSKIEKIVSALDEKYIPPVDNSSTSAKKGLKTKSYDELSEDEKAQLVQDDPDRLKALYKESKKNRADLF